MKIDMTNAATFERYSVAPVSTALKGGLCPQRARFAAGITTPGLRPWSRLIT